MSRFYLSICFCVFACSSYAQIKSKEQSPIQKTVLFKSSNTFLNAKAAFELYKKTSKLALTTPAPPPVSTSPQTYTFIWPQLKDGENSIFFLSPVTSVSSDGIGLFDGDFIIQIPHCYAPGLYLFQINCSFPVAATAEMRVVGPVTGGFYEQIAVGSMIVAQQQETNFVLGVNLIKGENILRINCVSTRWNFHSLKISPVQY